MFSIPHMIIIFVVVLIVFGPQKLPELARGLGKLMAEFRKASGDFKSAFEQEMRDMERQTMLAERKKQAEAAATSAVAQPATLAAIPGAETTDTHTAADTAALDTRETEASAPTGPTITPVAEAIPRSFEAEPDSASALASATAQVEPANAAPNTAPNGAPHAAASTDSADSANLASPHPNPAPDNLAHDSHS